MLSENGITTEYVTYNGLALTGYDKTGEQTEHYYYGTSLLAAELATSVNENKTGTNLYYNIKNSHGDVIGLSDNDGTLTETYTYDAFGTLTAIQSLNENGILTETETAISRFLYAGEQYDSITELYYLRARHYDTTAGRFTQEDTYLGDGRNLYVYVGNNPLKYVDPSGSNGVISLNGDLVGPLDDGASGTGFGGTALLIGTIAVAAVIYEYVESNPRFPEQKINSLTEENIAIQDTVEETIQETLVGGYGVDGIDDEVENKTSSSGKCTGDEKEKNSQKADTSSEKASSRKLRKNMENKAMKQPKFPNAAHHIVAGTALLAEEARRILEQYKVSINDAVNGVFLPTIRNVSDAIYHYTVHTKQYYEQVNALLAQASTREEVIEILNKIAEQLMQGTFFK